MIAHEPADLVQPLRPARQLAAGHEFDHGVIGVDRRVRAHLQAQSDAVQRTDIPHRTRLLADFHVLIAQMLGNEVLAGMLSDLVSRCSLIALVYQSAHSAEHSLDDHVAIVDALERRDARGACRLMLAHLHDVERNLQWDPRAPDLESVLRPEVMPAAPPPPNSRHLAL